MQSNPLFYAVTIKPWIGCSVVGTTHYEIYGAAEENQREARGMTRESRKLFLKGRTE